MTFVDGDNFLIRGCKVAQAAGIELSPGRHFEQDAFLWIPAIDPWKAFTGETRDLLLAPQSVRSHYYTSVGGDENKLGSVKQSLRDLGFDPHVFKRPQKGSKSKGVDIALTKDALSHAFLNNYDVAVIFSGDGDYIPLIEEIKRLGKIVLVSFIDTDGAGLNSALKVVADDFIDITDQFLESWRGASS